MFRSFAVILLISACGQEPTPTAPGDEPFDALADWTETESSEAESSGSHSDEPLTLGLGEEICDGFDNDGDELIDEELASGSCVTAGGVPGVLACLLGHVRCAICQPGETRLDSCACAEQRVDTCDSRGEWAEGPCDGCTEPPPVPCGFCGHLDSYGNCVNAGVCEPGDRKVRRCDACPSDQGCGAHTCVGQAMLCSEQCQWQAEGHCDIYQPQCTRDLRRTEPCGQCGEVELACDGCFWRYQSICEEVGECVRGSQRNVACDGGCSQGGYRVATQTCSGECRWQITEGCSGCEPGGPYTRSHSCACTSFRATEQFYCERRAAANSCGLGIGVEVDHTMLDECPPVTCHPGQTEQSGGECRTCKNDCEWGDWGECGPGPEPPPDDPPCTCNDGQTRVVSCNDLCGNTTVETCSDCSWDRAPCPHCDH